jgi:RNase H-like domain found in reverse transcriptase
MLEQIQYLTYTKKRLCREGVLVKDSNSEWAVPTFIPKKEGTVRFVTDFRQLNKALKRKPFPIPIQDILQKIGGFTYAMALDLNMGYYNIRLDPNAAALCALILPWGKNKHLRLPMGIKNSPDIFHQKISDQLGSVIMQDRKPVAFYSRKLNPAQRNYTTGKREMLSIVETLRAYRNILLGHKIIIYTDHQNLVNDQTHHESAHIQQWVWLIEEFGPKFKYLLGPENVVADALSRLDKAPSPSDEEDIDKSNKPANLLCYTGCRLPKYRENDKLHLAENVFSGTCKDDIVFPLSAQEISKHQRKDQELMRKLRDKPGYSNTVLKGTDLITYQGHNLSLMLYKQAPWNGTIAC